MDEAGSNRTQRLQPRTWKGELFSGWLGAPLLMIFARAMGPLSL